MLRPVLRQRRGGRTDALAYASGLCRLLPTVPALCVGRPPGSAPPPPRDRPPRPAAECPGAVSRAPADRGRIAKPRATEFRTITAYVAVGKVAPNGPLRRGRNRAGADSGLDVRPAWHLGRPSRPKVLFLEALFVWAFLF